MYQADKRPHSLNLEGLLLYDNKLISAKVFNKKLLIIILIQEVYTQKSLAHPGVTKTKKLLEYSYY
jgi:hypothetical protein